MSEHANKREKRLAMLVVAAVVLGFAVELDCIFKLKQRIQQMSRQMVDMSEKTRK